MAKRNWTGWAVAALGMIGATALSNSAQASVVQLDKQALNSSKVPTQFVCGSAEGYPATIARTKHGDFPVIMWRSHYFTGAGWTPERRCQEVSARLQTYYSRGQLIYLAAGYMNNTPVICTVRDLSATACDGLVFTLRYQPNSRESLAQHAAARLQALRPIGSSAVSQPLYESYSQPSNTANTNSQIVTYFDLQEFLRRVE